MRLILNNIAARTQDAVSDLPFQGNQVAGHPEEILTRTLTRPNLCLNTPIIKSQRQYIYNNKLLQFHVCVS